jgi:hypothetical protein
MDSETASMGHFDAEGRWDQWTLMVKRFDPNSFEGQIIASLSRMEESLKALPDHERRIRYLERIAYGLLAVWAFVVGLVGWIGIYLQEIRKAIMKN